MPANLVYPPDWKVSPILLFRTRDISEQVIIGDIVSPNPASPNSWFVQRTSRYESIPDEIVATWDYAVYYPVFVDIAFVPLSSLTFYPLELSSSHRPTTSYVQINKTSQSGKQTIYTYGTTII